MNANLRVFLDGFVTDGRDLGHGGCDRWTMPAVSAPDVNLKDPSDGVE